MTAKPVLEHISDERLLEALKPFAALGQYLIDQGFITKPDDAGLWGFDDHTLTYGDFRAAAAALTELQHRREAEAGARVGSIVDDQYVGPFTKCSCGGTKLELRGKFWCCTKCGASYGEHAGPAASPSSPASGVRVKVRPLDWPDTPRRGQRVHCTPLLRGTEQYCITHHGGDGPESVFQWARASGPWSTPVHSYDAAKAAAQADYEARIRSALGEHP